MVTGLEAPAFSQGTNAVATNIKRPITKYKNMDIHIQSCKDELSDFGSVIYDKKRYIEQHEEEVIASATSSDDKKMRIESIKRAKEINQKAEADMETEKTNLRKYENQASTRSGKVAYTVSFSSEDKLRGNGNRVRTLKEMHAASQTRRLARHRDDRERDERKEKKRLGVVGKSNSSKSNSSKSNSSKGNSSKGKSSKVKARRVKARRVVEASV